MQLALGILLTLLMLLPGMAFRYSFEAFHSFHKKLNKLSLTESLPVFLIPSVLIHACSIVFIYLLNRLLPIQIHYDSFFLLAVGQKPESLFDQTNGTLQLASFGLYVLFTMAMGVVLAKYSLRWEILNKLISNIFIIKNPFASLFENVQIGNDIVYLDVLVVLKEGSVIYTGLFKDYILKPDSNDLDSLILTGVSRMYMQKSGDGSQQNEYGAPLEFISDHFIILASQISNVNVRKEFKIEIG